MTTLHIWCVRYSSHPPATPHPPLCLNSEVAGPSSQLKDCKFFRTGFIIKPDQDGCLQQEVEPFVHPEVNEGTDYFIPHIKEKLPIGIALSGGGFRAATCAVGFMRGIHNVSAAAKGYLQSVVARVWLQWVDACMLCY